MFLEYNCTCTQVTEYESSYWKQMMEGTGVNYNYSSTLPFKLWSDSQCSEVDSQFFYSGAVRRPPHQPVSAPPINPLSGMGPQGAC